MTYEQVVAIWLEAVQKRKYVDYADKRSVKEYNHCTDCYRKAARKIDKNFNDRLHTFAEFLGSEDGDIRAACAVCLLELTHYPPELESRALEVMKERAENAWDTMGFSLWLENWEKGKIKTQYTQ